MFGNLVGKKKPATSVLVIARLNDRAQPIDRGDLYEDPLDAILKDQGLGEVTGGGTQLGKDNEIEFCDIEIQLHAASDESLDALKSALEELGAPKGSKLIVESSGQELSLGTNEGLAVYLNGTDLPAEVYQTCDVNFVYQEFNRLLGSEGTIHSHWQGPRETALYMYGRSFDAMKTHLQSFIDSYPLCQKARVVQIA
jgi:hypothetical protein